MAEKEIKKEQSIENLVAELNKELKIDSIQVIGSSKALKMERISTGSLAYDISTGGGFPISRHTTLYGLESCGKTTSALMALVQYQKTKDKRFSLFVDAEFALDMKYAKALGVDLTKVIIIQPDHLAEGSDVLMGLLKRDAIGLFIVDSIAALLPKSVLENEADASNIGVHAKAIGNMFKMSNSYVGKNKVTGIWINQVRDLIGGYGGGVTTPAGHAPRFYSSIMIQVFRGTKVDNGDGTFTNRGKLRVTKNKTFPPYAEAEYDMEHGSGISTSQEVLDYGVKTNVLYKKGHSFYYDDTFTNNPDDNKNHIILGKSKADAKQMLNDNLELRDVLFNKIVKLQFTEE